MRQLGAVPGRAVSGTALMQALWGETTPAAAVYLRLYIRYLRHKLEVDPRRPEHLCRTRGDGYVLRQVRLGMPPTPVPEVSGHLALPAFVRIGSDVQAAL